MHEKPKTLDCGLCILSGLVPISETLFRLLLKSPLSDADSKRVLQLMREFDMILFSLEKFTLEHFPDRMKEFLVREGLRRGYID